MKALVVEDDVKTAGYLQQGLQEHGFSVDVCHDGSSAFDLACERDHDLYVFDVMLPYLSGFDLLRKLRSLDKTALAVFITAKDHVSDKVTGLGVGADAYIVKPFSFSEFIAIVRSLQRRLHMNTAPSSQSTNYNCIDIGDLKIDLIKHVASRKDTVLELTPIEFRLLVLFARHLNEVLSRTIILEQVWDVNFDCNTNVVDVHVRRLRAKLDEPFGTNLIRTIRGFGYSLNHQG